MLITSILLIFLSNALNTTKERSLYYSRLSLILLITDLQINYENLYLENLGKGIGLYNGLFNINSITLSFNLFLFFISIIILFYNSFYHLNKYTMVDKSLNIKVDNHYYIIEYPLIILFVILGNAFLMSSADLISIFVSIELQSYSLYILCGLYRNSEKSTWASLTYFLLGGLSSCLILLGSCLLYINSGTTNLDGIFIINSISEINNSLNENINITTLNTNINYINSLYYINISLVIFITGLLFKVSAAPFHFWSPDVYDAVPTIVTTAVAILPKLSVFVILLELVYYINKDYNLYYWKNVILISSLLSLVVGSLLGLTQIRIKRLYAYSTISHIGFILLCLGVNKIESIQAYIFYIVSYSFSNLNAFLILVAIGYVTRVYIKKTFISKNLLNIKLVDLKSSSNNINLNNKLDDYSIKNYINQEISNSPLQLNSQLKGFFFINSYLSLSLCITLFSFVGIPPLIGFFAKQMVLSAALDNGYLFISFIGIITSVISAAYYLNLVKLMFFFKSDFNINFYNLSSPLSTIISVFTLIIIGFIFIPNETLKFALTLTLMLFN